MKDALHNAYTRAPEPQHDVSHTRHENSILLERIQRIHGTSDGVFVGVEGVVGIVAAAGAFVNGDDVEVVPVLESSSA